MRPVMPEAMPAGTLNLDVAREVAAECGLTSLEAAALLLHESTYSQSAEARARTAAAIVNLDPRLTIWNGSKLESLDVAARRPAEADVLAYSIGRAIASWLRCANRRDRARIGRLVSALLAEATRAARKAA